MFWILQIRHPGELDDANADGIQFGTDFLGYRFQKTSLSALCYRIDIHNSGVFDERIGDVLTQIDIRDFFNSLAVRRKNRRRLFRVDVVFHPQHRPNIHRVRRLKNERGIVVPQLIKRREPIELLINAEEIPSSADGFVLHTFVRVQIDPHANVSGLYRHDVIGGVPTANYSGDHAAQTQNNFPKWNINRLFIVNNIVVNDNIFISHLFFSKNDKQLQQS